MDPAPTLIPQDTTADIDKLVETLAPQFTLRWPTASRVFLFGSWAMHQKSFTEADVDLFVGTTDYDYEKDPFIVEEYPSHISITTNSGEVYHNRLVEIHYGDVDDLLAKTWPNERIELTDKLIDC